MKYKSFYLVLLVLLANNAWFCNAQNSKIPSWEKSNLLFIDSCSTNWQLKWMLDGERSRVLNTNDGMELIAGPDHGNDTCHTVLWTKQSFNGNICIEYDYTRTDTATRCVNILYFLATGKGDAEFPLDIALWNEKRKVPRMRTYFNNMHTYHISYAAFSATEYSGNNDYISARRYDPALEGLNGSMIQEKNLNTGLFKTNVTYHIEVYRYDTQIEMHIQNIQNPEEKKIYAWDASVFPTCETGRIGLRHMYTRSAIYKDFKVWKLK